MPSACRRASRCMLNIEEAGSRGDDLMTTDAIELLAGDSHVAQTAGMADLRRVIAASTAGSAMEWCDFSIYGTASALIFADLFFPGLSKAAGLLAIFGAYTAGFCHHAPSSALRRRLQKRLEVRAIRKITIAQSDRSLRSIVDHMRIIEALEKRDTELVERLVRQHSLDLAAFVEANCEFLD
ncbi:FCD domain-containing protein [Paraburkholderia sp. SIMBA_030]|uniref:FCD domain-containing protein n=1 Tax=Paraburkholderia sp. SIMBA_030 TaxID=3085773 RepID=UPI00397DF589